MNHLLVDFENTQNLSLERLAGADALVHIVIGANQKDRLPFEWVQQFQRHATQVRLLAVSASGKNALDFHIAWLLGQLTAQEPHAAYHILSNDTGFDPLVNYLRNQGFQVSRSGSTTRLPFLRDKAAAPAAPAAEPAPDRIEQQLLDLPISSRPRKLRTLKSWIASHAGKPLTAAQTEETAARLQARGVFSVSGKDTLSYGA